INGFGTLTDVGIFRTAWQICMICHLVFSSFTTMIGPHLGKAASAGDAAQLRKITLNAGMIGVAICLPVMLICLIAPEWLLGLFGPEFREGALALQVLIVSQVVNVAFGPAGSALIMLRNEKFVLFLEIFVIGIGLIATIALLPSLGIVGASIGALLTVLARSVAYQFKLRSVAGAMEPAG
ncbi:MAG: hypothetical protein WA957_00095, partial [Alteraurantiacibacter sp.]